RILLLVQFFAHAMPKRMRASQSTHAAAQDSSPTMDRLVCKHSWRDGRGVMAALTYDPANPAGPSPDRNVLLRVLDALAEWLMRQELRVINRSRPLEAAPIKARDERL